MKELRIASLVEGDGEVDAVPLLIRRVVERIDPTVNAVVRRGFRHPSVQHTQVRGVRACDSDHRHHTSTSCDSRRDRLRR